MAGIFKMGIDFSTPYITLFVSELLVMAILNFDTPPPPNEPKIHTKTRGKTKLKKIAPGFFTIANKLALLIAVKALN